MNDSDDRGRGVSRRTFLIGSGAALAAGGVAGFRLLSHFYPDLSDFHSTNYARKRFTGRCVEDSKPAFALPGRYLGKVVEVHDPASVRNGEVQAEPVRQMMDRGMMELTGAPDSTEAWRSLFQKGDRVGIKVNPVGRSRRPGEVGSISSVQVILGVVEGLKSAGLGLRDIVLFERYADEFRDAGYADFVEREMPAMEWYASAAGGGERQIDLEGRDLRRNGTRPDPDPHVLGYDPDVFRRFDYTMPSYDPSDGLSFQSHLSRIVTGDLANKIITIPTLKDHRSAGITIALKNLSHGLVSNVARTHAGQGEGENRCGTFIPRIVALEPIRKKSVLHIADGLIGVYEGGPGSWMPTWGTWEYKSLLFATDPVSLDHVGWDILDAERARRGWAAVAKMGIHGQNPAGKETFFMRQPEHVELAGSLNLGIFDPAKIEYRQIHLNS